MCKSRSCHIRLARRKKKKKPKTNQLHKIQKANKKGVEFNLVYRRLLLIWYLARSLLIRKEFYCPKKGVMHRKSTKIVSISVVTTQIDPPFLYTVSKPEESVTVIRSK